MIIDDFYSHRFAYDKSEKIYILNNKINTFVANAIIPRVLSRHAINRGPELQDVIVSLTSYPPRIEQAALCIDSLLRQTRSPKKLILWLARTDYPSIDEIPYCVKKYIDDGLEIRLCEDIKSYKKIYYTAKEYYDYRIVTADDDFFYPSTWLEELDDVHKKNPNTIVCHRSHRIIEHDGNLEKYGKWDWYSNGVVGPSHNLHILTGAGAIFPAGFFKKDFFDIDAIKRFSPTTDDMWVKVYALKHNVKVMKVRPVSKSLIEVKGSQKVSLIAVNQSDGNDKALNDLLNLFDIDIHSILEDNIGQ